MSFRRGNDRFRLASSIGSGLLFLTATASANEVAPYRVALSVRWGEGAGSDAFRGDLSRSLAVALAGGCFVGVEISGRDSVADAAEFVFDVVLSGVLEETRFDDTIAGTLQPGEPAQELRRVTHFEVSVDAALTARANQTLVKRKHLVARASRRPVYVGEDAQATVRADAIDDVVRDLTRALGCGGDKFVRKLDAALGDARPAPPGPR